MKFKKITWEPLGDSRGYMSSDDIPKIIYRIDRCILSETPLEFGWSLQFFHGFSNEINNVIYRDESLIECKWYAQNHFENYIKNAYTE